MGCASTTVRISYIILNIILAILAIAIIIWISFNPDSLREEIAISAYIACSLIVFFAFLGCFAAIRESVNLTATCAAFLLILAIIQIVFTSMDTNEGSMQDGNKILNDAWNNQEMDSIQSKYECCGRISANDYILLNEAVPLSCYVDKDSNNVNNLFTEGCSNKLHQYYNDEWWYFKMFSWILIALEILGFLLALFLVINFRNTQRRMRF